ncbi:MAG: transporter [Pirellula sp.]
MSSSRDRLLAGSFECLIAIGLIILVNGADNALAQERLRDSRTLAHWLGYQEAGFEDDSLNSERPTFTPNSTSLGSGVFQVETGYLFTRQAGTGVSMVDSHQLPETQLRWGIFADWLEFRISQAFLSQEEQNTRFNGASDTQIGLLMALTKQRGYVPECAWIPYVTVPSGSRWASDGQTLGGAALSYSWGFGESWTLGASTQMNSEIDNLDSSTYLSTYQSCYLKRGIGDKTSVYGEWYASFPYKSTSAISEHFVNTGVLVLFRENLQWDARVGMGLVEGESNVFAGTGITIRFH